MHISSLPGEYGIGKMGKEAYAFADFLQKSGISVWQILPISPTSYGDSPYQSFSVHAGNPYFIDFETLEKQGLLEKSEYSDVDFGSDPTRVDYEKIYYNVFPVLRKAYERFDTNSADYKVFLKEKADWIYDYGLFMALKEVHGGAPWQDWEKPLAMFEEKAVEKARKENADLIEFYCVMQYWFYSQWLELKAYCNEKGISIVGDIPIYVAYDSVDVWKYPELFCLDEEKTPIDVAGCPPDFFSATGQLWGNPLYDWDYHKKTCYAWWIERLRSASVLYDTVRIDHFRGFESYYAIPYGNPTAEIGEWRKGPDAELFEAAKKKLGEMSIIAEDLGFITPEVREMLDKCGYPGMKVLQFAFDGDSSCGDLPHNYTTSNCVVYTGTHDNMTLRGWMESLSPKSVSFAKRYFRVKDRKDLPWELIRAAWSSTGELAVAQIQDFLDENADARMNTPATPSGNWQYRAKSGVFTAKLAKKIYALNELFYRLPIVIDEAEKEDIEEPETKTEAKTLDKTTK